jgi:thiamine transport system permease protein
MPAVVVATGVKAILPNAEVPAILWAHVVFNVAVVVRVVGPTWSMLDTTLEDTAADLGAGRVRTFFLVVLPHIRTSLRNASAIVFLFCFTSFAVVAILGGISHRTIESEIFTQAVRLGDLRTATSLALLQAIVVLLVLRIGGSARVDTDEPLTLQSINTRSTPSFGVWVSALIPLVIVVAPLVAVVIRSFTLNGHVSFSGYRWLFDGSTEAFGINMTRTIATSLVFASMCAGLATLAALIICAARNRSTFIASLTALPLVVSAVTLGLGLIITFDESPIDWRSQRWLIPVVHTVIAVPLALRTLQPAVSAIPADLYEASASLGANPWRTWARVELPLIRPALLQAAGFSAAVSLGEFGATSFLSRSDTTTIPIAIGQLLGRPGDVPSQSAFALASLVAIVIALAPQVRRNK